MSSHEQRNYFDILKRYERKFEERELFEYKILLQRHKDDEDLDKLSMKKIKELYNKYHVNREKKNYDQYFSQSPQINSEEQSS